VFLKPGSAEVTSRYEALRVLTGHDDTQASEDFCARYEIAQTPTLLVLGADGAVVLRHAGTNPTTVADVLAILREAERASVDYQHREARLCADTSPEGLHRLAKFWADHYQHALATPLIQRLAREAPRQEEQQLLASILGRERDTARYTVALRQLIREYPAAPERISWQIDLALADLPAGPGGGQALIPQHLESVRRLHDLMEVAKDPMDRASIHGELAMRYEEVMWFPEAPQDSEALMHAHHAEVLKLRRLDPKRPRLLVYLGHALDWSVEPGTLDIDLARGWLQAVARVDMGAVNPGLRALLEMYTNLVQRALTDATK
jgi:hypothetical protein